MNSSTEEETPSFTTHSLERLPKEGGVILEASAGTGKTYALIEIVTHLILKEEIPLEAIVVVTFTERAGREIRSRIRQQLESLSQSSLSERGNSLIREAKSSLDSASIFTIHSFCRHALSYYPLEWGGGFSFELTSVDETIQDICFERIRERERSESKEVKGLLTEYFSLFSIEEMVEEITRLIKSNFIEEGALFLPEKDALRERMASVDQFNRGEGELRESLNRLSSFAESAEVTIDRIRETLRIKRSINRKSLSLSVEAFERVGQVESFYDLYKALWRGEKPLISRFEKLSRKKLREICKEESLFKLLTESERALIDECDVFINQLAPFHRGAPEKSGYRELVRASLFTTLLPEVEWRVKEERRKSGEFSFNDLINDLHRAVTSKRDLLATTLKRRYRAALIDEFQDTDRRQWEIFYTLFGAPPHQLYLIGDPKQSIYRFRGADLDSYYGAKKSVSHSFRLDTNYRSQPSLTEAVNLLFEPFFNKDKSCLTFHPVNSTPNPTERLEKGEEEKAVTLLLCSGEGKSREALRETVREGIAQQIKGLLSDASIKDEEGRERAVYPQDIAILTDTNSECRMVQKSLKEHSIPVLLGDKRSVYKSAEAEWVQLTLKALINPIKGGSLSALLLSPLFRLTGEEAYFLKEEGGSLYDALNNLREEWEESTVFHIFRKIFHLPHLIAKLLRESGVVGEERAEVLREPLHIALLREGDGERSVTNLDHLIALLHSFKTEERLSLSALNRRLKELIRSDREEVDDSAVERLERESHSVSVMTVHASKGLEFPIVFYSGGIKGEKGRNSFYSRFSANGQLVVDFMQSPSSEEREYAALWEERKRLFYVAATRAKIKLYFPFFIGTKELFPLHSLYYTLLPDSDGGQLPLHRTAQREKREELLHSIETMVPSFLEGYSDTIEIKECQLEEGLFCSNREEKEPLTEPRRVNKPQQIAGRITPFTSFSRLTALSGERDNHLSFREDRDDWTELSPFREPEVSLITPETLTRGAVFGELIHTILEELTFTDFLSFGTIDEMLRCSRTEKIIKEAALHYFSLQWYNDSQQALWQMIWNILETPLLSDLRVKEISETVSRKEIEFIFSVEGISDLTVKRWQGAIDEGFLKGFVDLLFCHNGLYYVVDWKTTVPEGVGGDLYRLEALEETMESHHYHLQSAIYTAALFLYLKRQGVSDPYSHIGGAIYLFVRAVSGESQRGIYHYKAEREIVEKIAAAGL